MLANQAKVFFSVINWFKVCVDGSVV
jgi:hypothetical protein